MVERETYLSFVSKRHSGGHGPDISVGAPEKVSEKERKVTVMLSMVEMPKVIFSPDSAGMRKTNLGGVFFSKFSAVF